MKGGKAAVAQRPKTAAKKYGRQTATDAAQVCTRYPQFLRLARADTERKDVVKDAVVAARDLIDAGRREDVGLRECRVAAVVRQALGAGEGIGFGKSGRPPWQELGRLIIAEAGVKGVLACQVVIEPKVEFAFLQLLGWRVDVVAKHRARDVGSRIQVDHPLTDGVDQARGNLAACSTGCLKSIDVSRQRITPGVTHKRLAAIRIGE